MAMPVSLSQVRPRWLLRKGRAIQATAASTKIAATRFSALSMGPILVSSSLIKALLSPPVSSLKPPRVSHHQATSIMERLIGTPTIIHWAKPRSMPWLSCRYPASREFGGVPIRVATPPMLAE